MAGHVLSMHKPPGSTPSTPKRSFRSLLNQCLHSLSPKQPRICILSLRLVLPFLEFHRNGIMQNTLVSLSSHNDPELQSSAQRVIAATFHGPDGPHSYCSPIVGHLSCLQFGATDAQGCQEHLSVGLQAMCVFIHFWIDTWEWNGSQRYIFNVF